MDFNCDEDEECADSSDDQDYVPDSNEEEDTDIEEIEYPLTALRKSSVAQLTVCSPEVSSSADSHPVSYRDPVPANIVKLSATSSHNSTDGGFVNTTTNDPDRRVWDKRNACLFCDQLQSKLYRHFLRKHDDEIDVKMMVAYKTNKRILEIERLKHLGNFYHNAKILQGKQGTFLVAKRPAHGKLVPIRHYVPCVHCKGYYVVTEMWRHVKGCRFHYTEENDEVYTGNLRDSRMLFESSLYATVDDEVKRNLLVSMKHDDIGIVCRLDGLIVLLGTTLLSRKGMDHLQYIRTKMREIGRLLIDLRSSNDTLCNISLREVLQPHSFDAIIQSVRNVCHYSCNKGIPVFEIPSLALKMGIGIRKCAQLKLGLCIRERDQSGEHDAEKLLKLMDMEYADNVSGIALDTLHTAKSRKPQLLPLTTDIVKFQTYVNDKLSSLVEEIGKQGVNQVLFFDLVKTTLGRIITFNKRRSGETAKMLLEDFTERNKFRATENSDLFSMMTKAEQQLSNRLELMHIRGKRGRTVPVVLTAEVLPALKILADPDARGIVSVNPQSQYMFPLSRGSTFHIRGCNAVSDCAEAADLQHRELFKSGLLRQYVATVSQVLAMDDNELDWLASHLGHDIKVHRSFYRLRHEHIELAKVSKLLIAIDQGKAHKYAGMKLNDITVPDLEDVQSPTDEAEEKPGEDRTAPETEAEEEPGEDQIAPETEMMDTEGKAKKMVKSDVLKIKKGKQCQHVSWSHEEKKFILDEFHYDIRKESLVGVGKKACEEAKGRAGLLLQNRTWIQIKSCIKNIIVFNKAQARRGILLEKSNN